MPRFINPFSDWGFKKIFGQEINNELLIKFLNDLLEGIYDESLKIMRYTGLTEEEIKNI